NDILIIGHKGASKTEPENTLRAFQKAIDLKADYIEFDIHQSKDGEIVVMHDDNTIQITGHDGFIKDMTLEELKELDCGIGERIPTLQEVINLCKGKIGLQIEVKVVDIGEKVVDLLEEADLIESTIISSFIHNEVLRIKEYEPKTKVAALISSRVDNPKDLIKATKRVIKKNKFYALHPHFSGIDKEIVDYSHNHNLKVNVWTVNEQQDMQNLINFGVDGIITDDIPLAKKLLNRFD
ncbi:MAG: glycerophosphodiester phosphodiesterase, partial [Candidatus Hodarchaeota archaeon]